MLPHITIDCRDSNWQPRLDAHMRLGGEAALIHFNFLLDGNACVTIAERYRAEFLTSEDCSHVELRNPGTKVQVAPRA